MPKYMISANYVGDGVKGLMHDGGTARRETVEKLVKSMGGHLETMYYAFGPTDVFVIADMPDNASAAAASLTAGASGLVTTNVTVLLTPEEVDAATKMTPEYRPPGA